MKTNILHTSYLYIVALLACLTTSVGNAWGADELYATITFLDNGTASDGSSAFTNKTDPADVLSPSSSVSGFSAAAYVYQAQDECGWKFGSGSYDGDITLTLASTISNVKKIVVNAKKYNSTKATTINCNSKGAQSLTNSFADYEFTYASATSVSSIQLVSTRPNSSGDRRAYVTSIAIYVESSGYAVTYNNGGHGTAPSNTTASAVTLSAITGVTGYTCTGWKADKAVTVGGVSKSAGTLLANGSTATLSAATTFTAQWSANEYVVLLEDGDGTGGDGGVDVTYNSNENITSVTVPTLSHFDFDGYYTGENGTGIQLIDEDGNWLASKTGYTDASKNWIMADDVTLYANWTEHSLTNYRTVCCTPIGTISGDVTCSSHTSTTATLGWTMASKTGLAASGIIIKVYRESDDALVYTSSALSKDATSHTTSATLSPCTSYYATLTTVSSGGSYCDGIEQGISDPFTTDGTYTYTINKDGVSLKGGETEATDNCSDFLAVYVADDGYTLPATITVTGASDYSWEDGVLGIDKADVTGNVMVDIEGVSPWCYSGADNSWGNTAMTLSTGGTYFYKQSSTNNHQFKIRKGDDWYGDNYLKPGFAMTNITDLYDYSDGACDDCNCYCTYNNGSYYIIVFLGNTFLNNASTPVICASTSLPDDSPSGLAETKKIYLTPNSSWLGSSAKFAVNYFGHGTAGWSAYMTQNPCDEDVWEVEIPKLYSDIIFVRMDPEGTKDWDGDWNQTGNLRIPAGKNRLTLPASGTYEWNGATETWSAYSPETFTISFDKGAGSGTMSSLTDIECNTNQALTANSFSKTGWTFSHWMPDVDVKVSGATVDAGDPIADEATIQNITEDITLTAQWTANKYDVTLKPNSGSGSDQTVQATYGSAMPLTVKTAGTAIVVPSRTGYDFNGYWDDASSGTQYYTYTGSPKALGSARSWDKTAATNLYAHWTAKQTTVSFNQNSGTGGQTSSVTVTYDAAMPTPITVPTREGHTFGGYYESTGGTGTQYYAANGSSATNWNKENATWTLYAKWTVNSYTLTWSWDGGSTSSTTHTAAGSVAYGTTLVYPANNTMSKTGHTFSGWSSTPSTMPATNTTITAQWTVNSHKVTLESPDNVTISATTPSITEGNYKSANYGSTVQLSYTGVTSGMFWGGWNVYKDGDPSTKVTVNGSNQFTMPDYDVKVSAYIYGDAIAWCDPDVTVTGDVHLTSTKDAYVHSTSAAGNLIEISSSDMGSATKMEVAYLNADAADAEVDKESSLFRLYNAAGSETIDELDLDYEWGTSHSIRYTPSANGVTNNYKLQLNFKRGDKVLKTVTKAIYGRSLPEEFVIACKYNDEWYALPNTMGTSGEDVTPLKITVDNTTTPTAASYAPNTVVYKGADRYTKASNINSIRFTKTGSQWLTTSGTMNMSFSETAAPASSVEGKQVWHLKSDNFSTYTLQMDPAQSNTKKLGIYGGKMGLCATPAGTSGTIYLLPITNKFTPIAVSAHEWGEHGVVVTPATPSDLSAVTSATMHLDGASPTSATTTAVNADMGTAKNVKVDGGALTVGAIANDGKQLYIHWKDNGGTEIGVSQIEIPCVIAANGEMKTLISAKTKWEKKEVHVLPGKTLTANAGNFESSAVTIKELHIYPGATLDVTTGTLTANTLRLHNGWTRAGSKEYNTARVHIADDAALKKTTASIDYDIYEKSDGQHYYPFAVPFATAVSAIDYADGTLASASIYGKHYGIDYYDGAARASGGNSSGNWKQVASDASLQPCKGYTIVALPVKGEAIIRVPLTYNDGWTADGELATYSDVTKNVIAVTGATGDAASSNQRNKGWYMLGVPFMSCYGAGADMYSADGSAVLIDGKIVVTPGEADPYSYDDKSVPYVSVPTHDFSEYIQTDITEADLRPGWSFFVQVAEEGNLTFAVSKQQTNDDPTYYAPQRQAESTPVVRTGIILSDGNKSDKTTLLISDKYSAAAYEINADLEKMFGEGYTLATYSLSGDTRLAYNAMSTTDARGVIPIGFRAPEDGEYTFSLNPRYANAAVERVDLIDYQTGEVTNLMMSDYTFTSARTQDDERFALNVVPMAKVPTGNENSDIRNQRSDVRKIILDDKMYIIYDGLMYDATGKRVTEIGK